MKKRKFLVVLIVCSMILYQNALCSAFTPVEDSVGLEESAEKADWETEELSYDTFMQQYSDRVSKVEDWKMVDGKYHYPITREDDEWYNMTAVEEKYAACQVPKEIIDKLNTDDLLELVLECPMLDTIVYYDSYFDGIKKYAHFFNAMDELQNRKDFYEAVVEYYDNLFIPTKQKNELDKILPDNPTTNDYISVMRDAEQMKKVLEDVKLEYSIIFCQTVIISMTENVEKNIRNSAGKILMKKFNEIEASEHKDAVMTKYEVQNVNWADNDVVGNMKTYLNTSKKTSTGGLFTRGGTPVKVKENPNRRKLTDAEKSHWFNDYKYCCDTPNSGVSIVEDIGGTNGYNCYNYAWLYCDDKYRDKYWKKYDILDDKPYYNDSSYGHTSKAVGRFQVGTNHLHAVLVTKTQVTYYDHGQQKTDVLVKSKWTTNGPLVRHPLGLSKWPGGYDFYC